MQDIQTLRQLAIAAPGNNSSLVQLLNHLIDVTAEHEERLHRCESRVQIALEAVGAAGEMIDTMQRDAAQAVAELRQGFKDFEQPPLPAPVTQPAPVEPPPSEPPPLDRLADDGGPPAPAIEPEQTQEKTHDDLGDGQHAVTLSGAGADGGPVRGQGRGGDHRSDPAEQRPPSGGDGQPVAVDQGDRAAGGGTGHGPGALD